MKSPKKYEPFASAIARNPELKALRTKYARASRKKRRKAAEFEYDSCMGNEIFGIVLQIMREEAPPEPEWPEGFLALAIDPLYAPALLTVGSVDYHYGFVKQAMELFLTLTKLPEDEEDLAQIIDKAGDFLLDQEDYENALELYLAAEKAYPTQALYFIGSGYCFHELGNMEEAVNKARRANELEPDNYLHLNDLGFSLLAAGLLEEAETVLKRSVSLAPDGYKLAQNNLDQLKKLQALPKKRKTKTKAKTGPNE